MFSIGRVIKKMNSQMFDFHEMPGYDDLMLSLSHSKSDEYPSIDLDKLSGERLEPRGERKTLLADTTPALGEKILHYDELSPKQKELYNSLKSFYTEKHLTEILIPIQTKQKPICLRNIEHLVTSYADSHDVSYIRNSGDNFPWKLYRSYQDQLVIFNKRYFDPCRRGQRIYFQVGEIEIVTTLAQINFFRWAIQNKVIEWAIANADAIREDMVDMHRTKKVSVDKKRKRKRALFTNATSPMILNFQIQVKLIPTAPTQIALK